MKTFEQYMAENGKQGELDALRARADGSYEAAKAQYESTGGGSGDPATDFINKIIDSVTQPLKEAMSRAEDFDKNNPFAFDEVLARKSSEERFDPYYTAELRDYISGVNRSRTRSAEDEQKVRRELDTTTEMTSGKLRRNIDETIRNTEEGFSGAGLLFSGARERETGMQRVEGEETLGSYLTGQDSQRQASLNRQSRTVEDLAAGEATTRRRATAERETQLQTDVQQQKTEEQKRRELERQNYIGYPLGGGTTSLSSLIG
jgi:hypothetical protein